ncbi:transcription initiation factor TFIIIB [Vibrio anguillarum]|uniref:transcription initiation factor TFIIIB n=1 Tax=Vibrio anguillarum TaxID=55601 RepID=UPI000CA21DA9|nr:transcription initiation factor TFIIIB [Vibrio anguillarum]AUB85915.1 transcription initiation factor TFIIIB [Vibrio anguillarum]AUB89353.1 transcription initiation factor TFIIIB [Vibrio anguillarum]AUB92794.1 transcription initiation factor TFIIIB [Vibrio anguillarum]AUB96227.1 transcription initiation factor TFIIIB [Vibrio anguillarum]AXM46356.1 transcription initiation factor TFIIIB [Vibrio anguillarum]
MKNINKTLEKIDCCPLCQHDEYFISTNNEKFICAQCGFKTDHLQNVQQMIGVHTALISHKHIHCLANNVH